MSQTQSAAERRLATLYSHLSVAGASSPSQLIPEPTSNTDTKNSVISSLDSSNWRLDGNQQGSILVGFRTIPEGCAVAVSNMFGESTVVEGPSFRFFLNESYQVLPRFVAGPSDYLSIQFKDGRKENVPGPKSVFFNPKEHELITVLPAVSVYAGYALVVYDKDAKSASVTRHIVKGPTMHLLKENQWLHHFFWWIPDQTNPNHRNRKMQRVKMVRLIPDHLYYNVDDVRTNDDAVVIIRLIIFFQLVDVEKMLDNTHDPPTDILTHVTADVIDFVSTRSFEKFKEDTELLNLTSTYKQAHNRCVNIGYTIQKVVFRGYAASDTLQAMHNSAIEARTSLKLKAETEAQKEQMEDMKQVRRHERDSKGLEHEAKSQSQRHEIEVASKQAQWDLEALEVEAKVKRKQAEADAELARQRQLHEFKLAEEKQRRDADLIHTRATQQAEYDSAEQNRLAQAEHERRLSNQRLEYLTALKDRAQVDVSGLLISGNYPKQKQADKVVKVVGGSNASVATNYLVHDSAN